MLSYWEEAGEHYAGILVLYVEFPFPNGGFREVGWLDIESGDPFCYTGRDYGRRSDAETPQG